MKRKKFNKNALTFIIISILLFTNSKIVLTAQNGEKLYEKIDLFSEVLEKIEKEYVEEIDQSETMDAAINGVLQSLDPYSAYMSPEVFKEASEETSGEFGGLGIEVSMEAGVVKVITPIDDTPAAKAGVKAGDYIVQINGEQVQGKTLMEAVNLMRGPVGTPIEITIRRKGLKKAKIFKPSKTAMQSGLAKSDKWMLEYIVNDTGINPLMGWESSTDTLSELNLEFSSKEKAIEYAKKNKIDFELVEEKKRKIIKKSYSDNFTMCVRVVPSYE